METKHTKGKWETFKGSPTEGKIGKLMSFEIYYGHGYRDEAIANAKLIAAAPELLEACLSVRKFLKENMNVLAHFPTRSEQDKLYSAIQKATK